MVKKETDINGHHIESKALRSTESRKSKCTNDGCYLSLKSTEPFSSSKVKVIAKEVDCPASKDEVEKEAEEVDFKQALVQMLPWK